MKRLVKASILLATMAILLSSCNCYNKMLKKVDSVTASSNPTVLVLKGNTVTADITVNFAPKYFHQIAVLKVTPVLVFEGGEIAGTPKFVQGEEVVDNYTVIPYKKGGSYTQTVTFPYDERASLSTLELRIESKCFSNCKTKMGDFAPLKTIAVAQGVSALQKNFYYPAAMEIMPDNFKRVVTETKDADIHYLINKSDVRKEQLTTEQIKMFESFVREYAAQDKHSLSNVYAKGYASPDGPTKRNDELAQKRSESGQAALSGALKDVNVKYDLAAYGEDWDGFKKLVEKSNIQDKDLILQVLNMYSSPVQREQEIKNMASVFNVLAKDILPQLRRTQFTANVDVQGKTDAELISAIEKGNVSDMHVEEALFASSLLKADPAKAKAYKAVAEKFNDARAYNNLGVALAKVGDLSAAKNALQKAASIASNPAISSNMGLVALAGGDVDGAQKYLASASSKVKSSLAFAQGNYAEAAKSLDGYNLALAEVCNGNLAKAKTALSGLSCGHSDYLRAVIAMKEGDTKSAVSNLKSAFSKDASLKAKALKDVEFAKLFGTSEFMAL